MTVKIDVHTPAGSADQAKIVRFTCMTCRNTEDHTMSPKIEDAEGWVTYRAEFFRFDHEYCR